MVYCVFRMCSAYVQKRFLCRVQFKSRKAQASHNWLIHQIQAFTHSNVCIGHADTMYSMYIQHGLCVEDVFCIYAAEVPVQSSIKIYKIASQQQLAHT